jgi:hypothetical protein
VENSTEPRAPLAAKVLPKPLLECLTFIFDQEISGTALVGGTALAGYYAGHRRSDDLDLFSANESAFRSAVLAAKELQRIGTVFSNETRSAQYFHANCLFQGHSFTIDVVLDPNLFVVGKFLRVGKIEVAALETLLQMKVAALVSRASEKDLFDVKWLFERFPEMETAKWISLGNTIDRGVTGESLLASIAGTNLREEACGFSLGDADSAASVYKSLLAFQKKLVREIAAYLKDLPTPPLGKLIRKLK